MPILSATARSKFEQTLAVLGGFTAISIHHKWQSNKIYTAATSLLICEHLLICKIKDTTDRPELSATGPCYILSGHVIQIYTSLQLLLNS